MPTTSSSSTRGKRTHEKSSISPPNNKKLTSTERRRKIQLSRERARQWAAAQSVKKLTPAKKRKAAASPPPSASNSAGTPSSSEKEEMSPEQNMQMDDETVACTPPQNGSGSGKVMDKNGVTMLRSSRRRRNTGTGSDTADKVSGKDKDRSKSKSKSKSKSTSRIRKKSRQLSPPMGRRSSEGMILRDELKQSEDNIELRTRSTAAFHGNVSAASVQVQKPAARRLPAVRGTNVTAQNPFEKSDSREQSVNKNDVGRINLSSASASAFTVPVKKSGKTNIPLSQQQNQTSTTKRIPTNAVNDSPIPEQRNIARSLNIGTVSPIDDDHDKEKERLGDEVLAQVYDDSPSLRSRLKKSLHVSMKCFSYAVILIILVWVGSKTSMNGSSISNKTGLPQCFYDTLKQRETANIYDGTLPIYEVADAENGEEKSDVKVSKFIPPVLYEKGISSCENDDDKRWCPLFGRCFGGFLVDCYHSSISKLGDDVLRVSSDHTNCELGESGTIVVNQLQSTLERITVEDVCTIQYRGFGLFRSQGDREKPVVATFSDIAKATIDAMVNAPKEEFQETSSIKWDSLDASIVASLSNFVDANIIDINKDKWTAQLSLEYLKNRIYLPFGCWLRLFSNQILQLFWSVLTTVTFSALRYYFRLLWKEPTYCILVTMIMFLLFFIRRKRSIRAKRRNEVSEMRELAYDMLATAEDSYAVLHLRDTITHQMFPASLKDRQRASAEVWPKVVNEVKHDSRIRKIEKNVGGLRTLHWEWISVPAKKKRRSSIFSPLLRSPNPNKNDLL